MLTPPTPPNYVLIYWLAVEATGKHTEGFKAMEKAKNAYEQELKAWLAKVKK